MATTLSAQSVYIETLAQSSSWTTGDPQFSRISISNSPSSTGTVTVTGGGTKEGSVGNGIVLAAGESVTFSVTNSTSGLTGVSVITQAGTTARIIAQ